MMCKVCVKAAETPDISQKKRNKIHAKCESTSCTCQHKPQGSWKGVGHE